MADATTTVALSSGVEKTITVTFATTVTNAAATQLWAEIISNGRIDEYKMTPVTYATSTARYWTDSGTSSPSTPILAVSNRNYPVTFLREDESNKTSTLSTTFADLVQRGTTLSRIVTPAYGNTITTTIGTTSTEAMALSSTFSGWGQYAGNIATSNSFNTVSFRLFSWDATAVPTQVRVRVRQMPTDQTTWTNNPSTYTLIADTTSDVTPVAGAFSAVTANLGTSLSLSGHVWVEYLCNGRDGGMFATGSSTTNLVAKPPRRHYVTGSSLSTTAWVAATTDNNWFVEFGRQSTDIAGYVVTDEFKSQLSSSPSIATVALHMPETVWALEGREANIYLKNIIRASVPIEQLWVDVSGTKGKQFGSFGGVWRYTPTSGDAGTTTLGITVRDAITGQQLASSSSALITRVLAYPASAVSRKLLCIGDSTLGSGGAAVLAELVNLFTGDANYTLTQIGSNSGNVNDSGAVSRAVKCDAISGWRVDMFSTNSTTAWTTIAGGSRTGSPFVTAGAFNFATYLSTYSLSMTNNDVVLFHLGINDIFNFTDDANVTAQISDMITRLEAMITNIQAAVSGVRIVMCVTIPPNDSQDAFGQDYSVGQTKIRYRKNRDILAERITSQFSGRQASKVFVLAYGASIDTVNNFGQASIAYNARNSTTYSAAAGNSGVHPAPSGYYQLADTIRAFLKGIE